MQDLHAKDLIDYSKVIALLRVFEASASRCAQVLQTVLQDSTCHCA
jgi:hypothetical protein